MTRRQILLALLPPLFFGTGFTIAKPAIAHFPPLFMMLMVYGGISVAMFLTPGHRLKTSWPAIMLIAAFCVTIQGALLFGGLKGMPATSANLILQTQVPFAVILGWLVGGEQINLRKSLGTAIALAGVAIVIGLPEAPLPLVPTVLVIAGAFTWALGQVLARKLGKDSGFGLLKLNAYGSMPQLALATLLFESGQLASLETATWLEWSMLFFVGVVGFYLAYLCWFAVLRQCRMDDVAPFILLMPVVGIATAYVFLGETISPAQVLGGLVLLAGLAIVSGIGLSQRRSAAAS